MKEENKNPVGRPKIIGGISKKLVATPKEWKELHKLLESIRNKQ